MSEGKLKKECDNDRVFLQKLREDKTLSLADVIAGDASLASTFKPPFVKVTLPLVLGASTLYPSAPHSPGGGLQGSTHQHYHFFFGHTELRLDGIKGGAIFPGHFHNSIYVSFAE